MKTYKVKIEGKTPYMQHRMDDLQLAEWERNRRLIVERDDIAKEDYVRALYHSYYEEDGKKQRFYIPSEQIRQSLINAGAFQKSKVGNARKSMKNIVAAMFTVNPEKVYISSDFIIDKRSAVNKNVKARVIVIRPRWEEWTAEFDLHVDNDTITEDTVKQLIHNDTITEDTVKQLIQYAGDYIGLGSYRPQNNGQFGRFGLIGFEEK